MKVINEVSMQLRLPQSWTMHVFHVSWLKPYVGPTLTNIAEEQQPEVLDEAEVIEPEQILLHRWKHGSGRRKRQFFTKFRERGTHEAVWLDQEFFLDYPQILADYLDAMMWKAAMEAEIGSIEWNATWELVPRPPRQKIIGVRWVYKTKYRSDGSLDKHKAPLVARGFTQKAGIDYDETFAPTARMTTIRIVLALSAHERWPVF